MIHGSLVDANEKCIIGKVRKTTNFLERMCGLLGADRLNSNEGLLIDPCSSVHTFGMRYTIDVLFLDRQLTIQKAVKSLKPWRVSAHRNSAMVLELSDRAIEELQLETGQQLNWRNA